MLYKAIKNIIIQFIYILLIKRSGSNKIRLFSEREEILTKFFKRCFTIKLTGKSVKFNLENNCYDIKASCKKKTHQSTCT